MSKAAGHIQTAPVTQTFTPDKQPEQATVENISAVPLIPQGECRQSKAIVERKVKSVNATDLTQAAVLQAISELSEQAGENRALFCQKDICGTLGHLYRFDPKLTMRLCALRLKALRDDLKSFSNYANLLNGRKSLAETMLNDLDKTFAKTDKHPHSFFHHLDEYEKEFNKLPLKTILDARFLDIAGANKLKLLSIKKDNAFCRITENLQQYRQLQGVMQQLKGVDDAKAALQHQPLPRVKPGAELTEASLLDTYISLFPAIIRQLVISWTNGNLLTAADFTRIAAAEQANKLPDSADALRDFLTGNDHLRHNLAVEVSSLHLERIYADLDKLDIARASPEALLSARQQCRVFIQLQEAFTDELEAAEVKQLKRKIEQKRLHIQARLIQMIAASEAQKPIQTRLFWIKVPNLEHIIHRLATTELKESTETRLYRHTIAYMDALEDFRTANNPCNLMALQQCRFDLLRTQQEQLVSEMTAQQKGVAVTVMGTGVFQEDMTLLEAIYHCRQTTAKYRPADSLSGNVIRLAGNLFWLDEQPLSDIKSSLHHNQALIELGYSFRKEFEDVFGGCKTTLTSLKANLGWLSGQVKEWAVKAGSGRHGLFSAANDARQAYGHAHAAMVDNLSKTLQVAERNPTAFRRVCGDFAQLVPQLKQLVGLDNGEVCRLLDQVNWRLSAESAATYFAGDSAINLDIDLSTNPDLAASIKRFQFFCDLGSGMLQGVTGLNAIKSALNGPAGIVGAILNVGSMYVTRNAINRMPADQIKLLDRLFRYGPVLGWITRSPFEALALGTRNMAQNRGVFASAVAAFLQPLTRRINPLADAVHHILHSQNGGWQALAIESSKCGAIIAAGMGVTCIAVAAVGSTGALGIAGTVFIAMEISHLAAAASYGVAKAIACLEDNKILNYGTKAVAMYLGQLFSEENNLTRQIRQRCQQEAAHLVTAMKKQCAYQEQITNLTAQQLYHEHWDNIQEKQSHETEVASFLQQSEARRREQAQDLLRQCNILKLINESLNHIHDLVSDRDNLDNMRKQLESLGVTGPVPAAGLEHYLLNLKQAATTQLQRQCGTANPGDNEQQISAYLEMYQREILLGSVAREQLTLTDPKIVEKTESLVEAIFYREVTTKMALVEQQRIECMITHALEGYVSDCEASGKQISTDDLEHSDMDNILKPRIERSIRELRTINESCLADYKHKLETLQIVQEMSEESRECILNTAVTRPTG